MFFGGAMVVPYILLAEPSNPRRLGDCGPVSGFGGRLQIRLRPSLLRGTHPTWRDRERSEPVRVRFVEDVLLHEMIHQWQQEVTGKTEAPYHGHGPGFRDQANAIGAVLGLSPVRTGKARGKDRDLPSCSQWPHCVRSEAHYDAAT